MERGRTGEGDAVRAPAPTGPVPARQDGGGGEPPLLTHSAQNPLGVLRLQRQAGNAAVAALLRPAQPRGDGGTAQRVHIDQPGVEENILQPYDQAGAATTDYEPHRYSVAAHYDLNRSTNSVDVGVKIQFIQPDGSSIPAGDPRRQYATDVTSKLVGSWNDRFSLTDEADPAAGGGGAGGGGAGPAAPDAGSAQPGAGAGSYAPAPIAPPVSLACRFTATPVFDATGDSAATVHLYPASVTADGTPGKRIDAGNWFMSKGAAYPAPPEAIAAHEFGHLIGIPDEYSQSNPSMHALFHQASPGGTANGDQQIDQTATKAVVLSALQPALSSAVHGAVAEITADVQASQATLVAGLTTALSGAWADPGFQSGLAGVIQSQATAAGKPALVTGAAEDLARAAASANGAAAAAAAAGSVINAGYLQALLDSCLSQIVASAHHVDLPIDDGAGTVRNMSVDIATSANVAGAATGTSPIAGDATTLAEAAVGNASAPAPTGSAAPLTPGGDLLAAIAGLPAQWAAARGLLNPKVDQMVTAMTQAAVAAPLSIATVADRAALAALEPGYLTSLGMPAAAGALATFLSDQFKPLFQVQLDALATLVQSDVDAQASGATLTDAAQRAASADPQVAAAVSSVSSAVSTLQAPGAAVPAAQMSGASAAPTDQNVKFTVQSLMGDNNAGSAVRPEYLQPVADQFNQACKLAGETDFHPKLGVGAGPGDFPTAPAGGTAVA